MTNATVAAVDVLKQRDELVQAVGRLVRSLRTGNVALVTPAGEPQDPADWLLAIIDGLRQLDHVIDTLSDAQGGSRTGAVTTEVEHRLRSVAEQMGTLGSVRLSEGNRPDYYQGCAIAVIRGCERLVHRLVVLERFFPLSLQALGENRPPSAPGWDESETSLDSLFNDVLATGGLPSLRRRELDPRAKRRGKMFMSRRMFRRLAKRRGWRSPRRQMGAAPPTPRGWDDLSDTEFDDFLSAPSLEAPDDDEWSSSTGRPSARVRDTAQRLQGEPPQPGSALPFTAVPRSAPAALGDVDPVDCTVFAPRQTHPGDEFLVQVFVHLADNAEEVAAIATEFDSYTGRRGFTSLELDVPFDQRLAFHLVISGMEVDPTIQSLRWRRRTASVEFAVRCPPTSAPSARIGRLTVSCDRVPVGNVMFTIEVQPKDAPQGDAGPVGDSAARFRSAFASYASGDRAEVVKRLQMLRPLGIHFFQDVLSLDPGDRWEQKLYRHIDEADLFLLFWSSAARRSEWVHKEVTYALARNGEDLAGHPAIVPIPIEGPPPVSPPDELAHLHFDDFLLYLTPERETPDF